ncbi:hypothetical protein BDF20DRAFT_873290 [Mycotypha africana]|uniref:uncharacterized protein n=1 Tax=Mycotypha africana TaxID=64632 RepID=UPI00230153F3|nr:uncharacterized protein BDF20DRAFT_873290 [Mycotypha africana]KAI8977153.1 hypothetical protein BDF20DRAFT_873290 [Mycotypha africana]
MNAFSMFYSHIMDSTIKHPALRLQDKSQMEAMEGFEELKPFIPTTNSPFEKKVDASLVVLIKGVNSPEELFATSFYVSDDEAEHYDSLLKNIAQELEEKNDISLVKYENQKTVVHRDNKAGESTISSDNMDQFEQVFDEIDFTLFDKKNEADRLFMIEVQALYQLEASDYEFIKINTLQSLLQTYGADSEKYKEAQSILKSLFIKHIIPNFQQRQSLTTTPTTTTTTFIMTPPSNKQCRVKRDAVVNGVKQDSCFLSLEACNNATSGCQGHGQCKATIVGGNDKCYTCQCEASYLGDSCQYVDAVGDFQLLFWTSVFLVVVTSGVVFCVYQSGSNSDGGIIMTQSAPKHE